MDRGWQKNVLNTRKKHVLFLHMLSEAVCLKAGFWIVFFRLSTNSISLGSVQFIRVAAKNEAEVIIRSFLSSAALQSFTNRAARMAILVDLARNF